MDSVQPPRLSARVRLRSVAGAAAHRPAAGEDRPRQLLSLNNTMCRKLREVLLTWQAGPPSLLHDPWNNLESRNEETFDVAALSSSSKDNPVTELN